jgi:hypothetical protein
MSAVAQIAATNCGLPVLRAYWYDGARDAIPTLEQLSVAELANVKLRLGRLSGGKQKGVDALVYRDLMTLAREGAVATAFLLAGDEDLREGVVAAQDMGVRVVVLGIEPTGKRPNQSEALIRECDQWIVLQREQLEPFITRAAEKKGEAASPEDLGKRFAEQWIGRAIENDVRELLAQRPVIPKELDVELIRSAEADLGSLRGKDAVKRSLRGGFWDALRTLARAALP